MKIKFSSRSSPRKFNVMWKTFLFYFFYSTKFRSIFLSICHVTMKIVHGRCLPSYQNYFFWCSCLCSTSWFFLPGDDYEGMCSCDSQKKRIFELFLNFNWNHWSVGEQKLIQWQIDGTSKHPPSKIHWWNFWTTPSNLLNHFKLIDLYSTFYLNFVYFFLFSF